MRATVCEKEREPSCALGENALTGFSPLCKCFQPTTAPHAENISEEREKKKETSRPLIKLILLGCSRTFCTACTRRDLLSRRSKAINRMEKIIDLLCNLLCCCWWCGWQRRRRRSCKKRHGRYIGEFIQYLRERVCISK